jgi:transposase
LLWSVTAAAGVLAGAGGTVAPSAGGASAEELQARVDELVRENAALREESSLLREQNAELVKVSDELRELVGSQAARLAEVNESLAVLQKMVFGRKSEKNRPGPAGDGGGGDPAGDDEEEPSGGKKKGKRGPGARAGRRGYPHLPRVEIVWDFPGGGYCCEDCGEPFTALRSDHVTEVLDWTVLVRVMAHCRRRYKRACRCPGQLTVTAPGPPRAIGKGLFSNGFTAMLLVERFAAGRSQNSLVTGLARHGAEISPATLTGTVAQAAALLAPLAAAIAERNRESWHFHADETTWRVFCPGEGQKGSVKWWLWVFIAADTVAFVMDPSRSGAVLARHAGIDEKTGQLLPAADGGPRRLVISSDFYAVYQSAGKKADGLVNLYCAAHVRRHMIRAGDASPVQLKYWIQDWLVLFRDLYSAHDELMAAWQENAAPPAREKKTAAERLEKAYAGWDDAIGVIDETRKKQMQAPGLQEPAKKALATLDREWDGLIAHRDYPMISLDNNLAERTIRGPVVTRKNAGGSHNGDTARNAAVIWTVTATAAMAGLNLLTYLAAYLDECGRRGGKPLSGPALERFFPWNASPEDLRTWAQPPPAPATPDQ